MGTPSPTLITILDQVLSMPRPQPPKPMDVPDPGLTKIKHATAAVPITINAIWSSDYQAHLHEWQ